MELKKSLVIIFRFVFCSVKTMKVDGEKGVYTKENVKRDKLGYVLVF